MVIKRKPKDWTHPEIKEGEIILINVKENERWGVPSFCSSTRRGKVAYTTNGVRIVEDMKPLFGKVKKSAKFRHIKHK